MFAENGFAADHARRISCAREVENLSGRTFRIARNARRARFEDAEIAHATLGRVAADQHDAGAALDALAREKSGDARRKLAQIGVRVLLLSPVALDAHCDSGRVTLRCRLKQLE